MTSNHTLALAVALPFGVLCLAIIAGNGILYRYIRFLHNDSVRDILRNNWELTNKLAKAEKQLAAFPTVGGEDIHAYGFSRIDIGDEYVSLFSALFNHVDKWVSREKSLPKKHSAAQLEAILFPSPRAPSRFDNGQDASLFPNPHHYTTDEIYSAFETPRTRIHMLNYILTSIVLKAVMLQGNPGRSLIPFGTDDVYSLSILREAIRTLDLSHRVLCHIANFWIYKSCPDPGTQEVAHRRQYYSLVESLLEPYFPAGADKTQQHNDFRKILDKATDFGRKVTGCLDYIEMRWGNREDFEWIVTEPAMYAVEYVDKNKSHSTLITAGATYKVEEDQKVQQGLAEIRRIKGT